MRIFRYFADFIGMNGGHMSFFQEPEPFFRGLLGQDCLGYLVHLCHVLAPGGLVDKAILLKDFRMSRRMEEAHPAIVWRYGAIEM